MPRRTCGPEPKTRSAPARIIACANARLFPRGSPRYVSSAPRDVLGVRSLGSRVHVDDDDVGVARGIADEARRSFDVEQALRPAVRRAADQRDPDVPQRHVQHLAGKPLLEEPRVAKRLERLALPLRAVVERVVVRDVEHVEAGAPQHARPRGRAAEREAADSAGALRRAARRQRSLEVADDEVARAQDSGGSRRRRSRRRRR